MKQLSSLRSEIRDIDKEIMKLMARRLDVAREVGKIKLAEGLPIKDYKVEKEIIERSRESAKKLNLYADLAEQFSKLQIKYAVQAQDEFHTKNKRESKSGKRVLIVGGLGNMGRWFSEFFDSFGHDVSIHDVGEAEEGPYPFEKELDSIACEQDVIVLASPISETAKIIEKLVKTGTKALVFDVSSLKTPLIDAIKGAKKGGLNITSIHPMFGPDVELLAGRNILFCECGDEEMTKKAVALFNNTTASLHVIDLEKHDELIGYILGFSHLSNIVFARVLSESGLDFKELSKVGSTTFNAQLDVTLPVISENQDLYYEIQAENGFTADLIRRFGVELDAFSKTIDEKDRSAFKNLMEESRKYLFSD